MERTLYDNNWTSNSLFGGNSMYSTGGGLRHNSSYHGKPGGNTVTTFSKRTPRASMSRLGSSRSHRKSKSPVRTAVGGKRMSMESFGVRNS